MDSNQPIIQVDKYLKMTADAIPALIWISGVDKLYYHFNTGWLCFTGRTMEQEYGKGWTEGVHPDDLPRCLDIYVSSFDARKEFKMKYRLKRHDETYQWLLENGVPRYTADGTFAGYIGSCTVIDDVIEFAGINEDRLGVIISEHSLIEGSAAANEDLISINDQLYHAHKRLNTLNTELTQKVIVGTKERKAILENLHNIVRDAPVGMCIVKGQPLFVVEANELFLEIIGKKREQFNEDLYFIVNSLSDNGDKSVTDQVMETGQTYRANEREIILIKNGLEETIYVDFVYEPIRNIHDEVDSIMIVAIEVTDKVLARKALEISAKEFQNLNDELAAVNEEFTAANEELVATNEEIRAVNEELFTANEELSEIQENLRQSEKLFKSIAVNIPKSLIMIIDKNHRYLTIEGDIMEKMGYKGSDYAGKHPAEVGSVERYEASRHLYDRMLSGEKFSIERTAESGDIYMVHFVPLKNENDQVESGLIIALDITDIKQAEKKSAMLAAIIASSDDAIISKTFESVITSWNDSAERIFGYAADEIIGETIYKLIPPDREDEEPQILARLKNGERVEHFETKRLRKDGTLIDVSVTVSPVKDSQGNLIGLSKIARDITEQKLDEQRKNDFIAMVSHELKTPLTSLSANIQLLQRKAYKNEDTYTEGALKIASKQVKKMTNMINGFLNVSRLEAGKINIEKQPFNIATLVKEIEEESIISITSHKLVFAPVDPIVVIADSDKIGQVLTNFISNAVKYSPIGGYIKVDCLMKDGCVQVSVSDEGMGIDQKDIGKLFDRYYRVEAKNNISGFGIGLYLSAEIINRHDGKIWVESELGRGSKFYFSLPPQLNN